MMNWIKLGVFSCSFFFFIMFLIFNIIQNSGDLIARSYVENHQNIRRFIFGGIRNISVSNKRTKKWIVVTSISSPTDDIKKLASLPDWTLVVVADTKTPENWHLDGVHFLSVKTQKELGFSILSGLPYKSYTRKNIGYLYAIMHGAEWIYDTDDDNKPFELGLEQFDYGDNQTGVRFQQNDYIIHGRKLIDRIFNPYQFFGRPDMWPRGFPLEYLSSHSNVEDNFRLCKIMRTPAVQQGLVTKDPDVDAVYRLLHADKKDGLRDGFNRNVPPVVLAPDTYAPWNSQNTLFSRRAFFTMYLPFTVEFRVTDIWRSYFSQKLLHILGETVGFYPPNAIQFRNSHDYLADFQDEKSVYMKSGKIIEFLDTWTCENTTIDICTLRLAHEFSSRGFWEEDDSELIKSWIDDLKAINYVFPVAYTENHLYHLPVNKSIAINCRRMNLQLFTDASDPMGKRAKQKLDNMGELQWWCSENKTNYLPSNLPSPQQLAKLHSDNPTLKEYSNTVLVVTNNWAWSGQIGMIQRLYSNYFAAIIFCGTYEKKRNIVSGYPPTMDPVNYIHIEESEMLHGHNGYYCIAKTKELRLQNILGYIIISDDVTFNLWHSFPLNITTVGHNEELYSNDDNHWKNLGGQTVVRALEIVKNRMNQDGNIKWAWKKYSDRVKDLGILDRLQLRIPEEVLLRPMGKTISDFIYIPSSEMNYFYVWLEIFFEVQLFHELAIHKILQSVPYQSTFHRYLWNNRDDWSSIYNRNILFIHPIKYRGLITNKDDRKKFCTRVVGEFRQILFTEDKNFSSILENKKI